MKISGLLTGVLVVIGIAGGFLVGRMTGESETVAEYKSSSGEARPNGPAKSDRHPSRWATRSGERDGESGRRSPAATIRQAARELELSPMAQMDFDAMFQFYDAIRWMNPDEIQVALAELEDASSNPQIRMMMSMMLINQWAKQDGRGAVEYALQQDNAMLKTTAVMGGMMGWARNDPESAYAWYKENRETVSKSGMMAGQLDGMILAALAQRDMKMAFEGLEGLNKQAKTMALSMMSSQMTMDPVKRDGFITQIEALDDADLRRQGIEGMISMWAFQDPKGAAEFIDSREWEGDTAATLRDRLTSSWANLDGKAALEWRLENLGENEDKGEVVASGFSQWMTQDPERAQEWLKAQPEEVLSDQLFQSTANQLRFRNSYAEAAEWAVQIEEQTTRESTLRELYSGWKANEEAAAQEWVEGLDEATRAAVENPAVHSEGEAFPTAPAPTEVED